ncbi:gamma-glutamyltransferase [Limobrevibacterium gyesilva]|uniref:Glutathione hydrolase proenzyme n=1 Tax=Limobrevibacterium gyesilva TaxID=2991712 RepID=A0AA41YQP6_9PROT|nr:gamma-glutamyltransferase [Limobrevibacterium gyesilva]MCW3477105.1 gamma-glutamyltransferase [Limobrevibacterium gyesilva]
MPEPAYNVACFNSRRSPVLARRGIVATAQPLASQAGMRMLLQGGNAIDAAVAAAAVLGVTEPFQTGLGGDAFALIHEAATGAVLALNASGPAPRAAQLEDYRARGFLAMPEHGPLSWTVPGCVDGWCQMLARCGTMKLADVLAPAIEYARDGFPVAPGDAAQWQQSETLLRAHPGSRRHLLIDGNAPRAGEIMVQPVLADTLRLLAEGGRDAFYAGPIAERLVRFSDASGGLLTRDDLAGYRAEWQQPIGVVYRGHHVLECPPNGQGIAALLALKAIEHTDFARLDRDGPACWHLLIEAMKYGMTEAASQVADPRFAPFDIDALLARVPPAASVPPVGPPPPSDTVFLAVVDAAGNAVSFINSVYGDFGSGWAADDLGFVLQNRGTGFSLDPAHPNRLAPGKRPYHTIIPAMALKDGKPTHVFGVTGGFMQPQGHLQLLVNLLDYGMDVQTAIDTPRFWWEGNRRVVLEDGLPEPTYATLASWGHEIIRRPGHRGFGGAQIIALRPNGVRIAGSEPRQDGCAIGY